MYFSNWKRFPLNFFIKFSKIRNETNCSIFLRIIKVKAAHLEFFLRFDKPMFINLLTSFFEFFRVL